MTRILFLLACVFPWQAWAGDVAVTVTGVRNDRGHVRVALCQKASFLQPHCPWQGNAKAVPGETTVVVKDVPPGTYAAQAFHDEDDNGTLDRNFLGLPKEGMGFSNNAPMHFGPPRFGAASFPVAKKGAEIKFALKYY
jgi:uncharacterized protein (DUF2141 family)